MSHARGCRPALHPAHETRLPFRIRAGASTPTPDAVDLRALGLTPPTKDQGRSNSCNPHRCSSAIQTRLKAVGVPLPWTPSEADLFRLAREIERARDTPIGVEPAPLEDVGTYTADCVMGIRSFGIRPRKILTTRDGRDSDVELETINDDQMFGELQEASVTLLAGEHAIDPAAPDTIVQVRAALAAHIPLGFDFFVDSAFEDWGDGWTPGSNDRPCGPPDMRDPGGGWHAILGCGYRTEPDGSTSVMLLNTWSARVGDGGAWWCSERWLRAVGEISVWDVRLATFLARGPS